MADEHTETDPTNPYRAYQLGRVEEVDAVCADCFLPDDYDYERGEIDAEIAAWDELARQAGC